MPDDFLPDDFLHGQKQATLEKPGLRVMGTIISMINNKGITGKTTTAVNLAAGLAKAGLRVLILGLRSQDKATHSPGMKGDGLSMADGLFDGTPLCDSIRPAAIPANRRQQCGSAAQ